MTIEISLPAKLDHSAASDLLKQLQISTGKPLRINAIDVKGVGGLGAQILLAAFRKWRGDRISFEIIRSEAMEVELQRLGMLNEIVEKEQDK